MITVASRVLDSANSESLTVRRYKVYREFRKPESLADSPSRWFRPEQCLLNEVRASQKQSTRYECMDVWLSWLNMTCIWAKERHFEHVSSVVTPNHTLCWKWQIGKSWLRKPILEKLLSTVVSRTSLRRSRRGRKCNYDFDEKYMVLWTFKNFWKIYQDLPYGRKTFEPVREGRSVFRPPML